MATLPLNPASTARSRLLPVARSSAVLAVSLALTAGVLTAMSIAVDTWSK